jgi:DHA1 family bicyclomycin/chloramphenicol resistance-like MFS transporter
LRASTGGVSKESRGFIIMLGAISALAPLGTDVMLPALPIMALALHTSDGMIQATVGAFILAFALGQLLVGPLCDRYGRRPVLAVGLGIFTLAGFACAGATDARLLVAARFVQGIGACAGQVVGRAIIRDVFVERKEAATMQAYASAISGVVPMLAPLLGVALLPLGWRAIYAALVASGALLLGVTAVWLPETLPTWIDGAEIGNVFERYRRFIALPRSLSLCALVAFSFAGLFAFISGSPFVLVRELGLSNTAYAVAFAISSGSILAGSWLAGTLAHRLGAERLLSMACAGLALAGAAAFALNILAPHAPSAWQFVAVMAIYGFTFGILIPGAFAAGMEPAGDMAGIAAGLLGATQMLGGSIGSAINGSLPFRPNVDVGFTVGIAGIGVAAAYIWSIRAARLASRPPRQLPV